MTTNVPLPTFSAAGLSVPTEPQLLTGVFADWVDAFALSGKTLSTELTTPQGQMVQSQAYMLSVLYAAYLRIINGVDPATATGEFQDALGRIYFLSRQPATYATVRAVVTGVVGTTLAAGAQAVSSDGTIWTTTGAVTFGPTGTTSVDFRAATPGAGPSVGANGLRIYQQRPGWETVSNELPSTPGVATESRQIFEARRAESVSIGGNGTAAAVRAAVANVVGVSDVFVYNNGSDAQILYGATGYPIPAHSIGISVAGGDSGDVAAAIHSKLDAGCGLPVSPGEGVLVTEIIEDTVNYSEPYPQYLIRFVRPVPVPIYVKVEVANLSTLPSTYISDVQTAVADAITSGFETEDGQISLQRARIGGQIVAANYFAPIQALGGIVPISINIGLAPDPTDGPALTLGIDQLPVTTTLDITVVTLDVA
jgi:hypothetical protein